MCSTNVLVAYDAAWNEPDQATRAQLLARSLTEDAELVDPTSGRFQGRHAINAADHSVILEGIDVAERDEDTRLRRVIMFFGPLPETS